MASKVTFSMKRGVGGLAASVFASAPASVTPAASQPPSSPPNAPSPKAAASASDEPDPLEAFMAGIDESIAASATNPRAHDRGSGLDHEGDALDALDEGDDDDDGGGGGGDDELQYDSDGNVIGVAARGAGGKGAPPTLPPVDHASIRYEPFRKYFYAPSAAITALTPAEAAARRAELGVAVSGRDPPPPVQSFMHLGLDASHPALVTALVAAGFEAPTPVQAQALPALLSGRDVLAVAQTGSGKTLAYLLPLLRHAVEQRPLDVGEGPIGLVLAPTRELASQIHAEARRLGRSVGLTAALLTGGSSKWEQAKALRAGAELMVATPGRLLDHLLGSAPSTNLRRVTFIVLDEADRMLDMGFGTQVSGILASVRPARQAALFSATLARRGVEALAQAALGDDALRLTVGAAGSASDAVVQRVVVLPNHAAKWAWLLAHLLPQLARVRKLVVFVATCARADELCAALNASPQARAALGAVAAGDVLALALHGDKSQADRDVAIGRFKGAKASWGAPVRVLVATDVAARGLDVPGVDLVLNFDAAKSLETHVHRVGRTGRLVAGGGGAGDGDAQPGLAVTLLQPTESAFAVELVRSLRAAGAHVPQELLHVAQPHPSFRFVDRGPHGPPVPHGPTGGGSGSGGKQQAAALRRLQAPGLGYGGHDDGAAAAAAPAASTAAAAAALPRSTVVPSCAAAAAPLHLPAPPVPPTPVASAATAGSQGAVLPPAGGGATSKRSRWGPPVGTVEAAAEEAPPPAAVEPPRKRVFY